MLLVEVLSDATRNCDRGDKFRFYKSIPTFREYLLIEQKLTSVEHQFRDERRSWSARTYDSQDEVVKLTALPVDVELPLLEVYRKVFAS